MRKEEFALFENGLSICGKIVIGSSQESCAYTPQFSLLLLRLIWLICMAKG